MLKVIEPSPFRLDRQPSFKVICTRCKTLQIVTEKMVDGECRECAGPRYETRVRNTFNVDR